MPLGAGFYVAVLQSGLMKSQKVAPVDSNHRGRENPTSEYVV
jgi:hypothetical protein